MYYKTKPYKVFTVFNYTFLILLSLLCIIPLIHILAVSFSGKALPMRIWLDCFQLSLPSMLTPRH